MFHCFYVYVTLYSLFFLLLILFILTTEMSNALISPTEIQMKLKKEIMLVNLNMYMSWKYYKTQWKIKKSTKRPPKSNKKALLKIQKLQLNALKDGKKWQHDTLEKYVIEEQRKENAKEKERSWIFFECSKTIF